MGAGVRQTLAGTKTHAFPPKYRRTTKTQPFPNPVRQKKDVKNEVRKRDRVFNPAKVFKDNYKKHQCIEAWKNYDRQQTHAAILQAGLLENAILEATREHTRRARESPRVFNPANVFKDNYKKHKGIEAWKHHGKTGGTEQTHAARFLHETPTVEYVRKRASVSALLEIRAIGNTIVNSIHVFSKRLKKSNELFAK